MLCEVREALQGSLPVCPFIQTTISRSLNYISYHSCMLILASVNYVNNGANDFIVCTFDNFFFDFVLYLSLFIFELHYISENTCYDAFSG